jgi:putative endonuclease
MLREWLKSFFAKSPTVAPFDDNQKLGEWGEQVAAEFLQGLGHVILERRFRVPYVKGEIDLITRDTRDHDCVVFVEVKTRRSKDFIPAEAAIHSGKRRAMIRMGRAYLRRLRRQSAHRYDVVSVYPGTEPGGKPTIEHSPGAFREEIRMRYKNRRPQS